MTVLAGIIIEVMTASRATIGLAMVGVTSLFTLSAVRSWNPRKMWISVAGATIIAISVPLAISSFERRQAVNSEASSDYDRASFIRSAELILQDHPMGIGSNQYTIVANNEGYNQKAGVLPNSRGSIVHNVYWLVATETGYLGLLTFVFFLVRPTYVALVCGWRNYLDQRGILLMGIGMGLLIVCLHSFF